MTRTRWAHHITATSLSVRQRAAYQQYLDMHLADDFVNGTKHSQKFIFLPYWSMTILLELLVMQFVKSLRTQLSAVCRDARKVSSVVICHDTHPRVYRQFAQGHFMVQKTGHNFSSMALDKNHDVIKGVGEAEGLTENPVALLRWMAARPKIATLVNTFAEHIDKHDGNHHEQSAATQAEFRKDVGELTGIVHLTGNPFFDDGEDLVTLDIKLMTESSVIQTLKTAKTIGQPQCEAFVQKRLVLCEKPPTDNMPKNNLSLFGTATKKVRSRSQHPVASLKAKCALLSRLIHFLPVMQQKSHMKSRPVPINLKHGKSATLHTVRS